jgi:preprotein translocase subunit SecB
MSDTTPAAPAEPIKNQAVALPIQINAQYTKDFSFENPRAPASLRPQSTPPHIDVNVDVQAAKAVQDEEIYEVVLKITAKGTVDNQPLFLADLTYAGLFQLQPMEQADMHTALLVECPRVLFPFARQIIADATRDGGFPPLMIQPVDFAAMYRQNLESGAAT